MTSQDMTIDLDPKGVRRILVCQLRQIGDVLLSTPSIRLLRKRFPNAQIHLLTEKKTLSMVENNPDVTRVWAIDKKAHKNIAAQLAFYWQVASQRYDLVVDFQQLPRIRWVVALSRLFPPESGPQVRLTYDPPWYNRWLYTHWSSPVHGYAAMTKASVLRPLGISWNKEPPRLFLTATEQARAKAILIDHGIGPDDVLITVDPSHRRATRQWPEGHYGELIRLASQADSRLKFLVFYGPGEEHVARAVQDAAGVPACIVTKSMLSLRDMAGCIKHATLHLGNCSAPRHMAVGVGTPTLTVLGSTSNAWTFPGSDHKALAKGLDCQPCNENSCPSGSIRCMTDFMPDEVLPELLECAGLTKENQS
ncbi:glycosyltransferase family 9 protein [Desulfovibrio ferrophilus]|uniref:Glycosyl transferase family 9 n=1 Tax=Desulfovibrio ferrophilus TaxID=241368 RepID=A0A2Z6AX67_9BACT|nr:glycosyltransferase family 9 protein [Desulfovibrio ferrophilus]BBD07847.1 glycosyl transferase family 9 [Desulfovibrio ferrophilus]